MKYLWISLLIAMPSYATTYNSWSNTREGLKKFEEKSYRQAYQNFMSALEDDPLKAETHLNIARSLEANEEYGKAEKGYRSVLKFLPKDSPYRFQALFNLGGVLGKQKKIAEALEAYQAALEIDPDNIEVKNNIELLLAQGGGSGEGDGEKSDKQDEKGKGQSQGQDQKNPQQQKKNQPKPFESQELTPQDVKKILDELKNQEQAIRAQENDKNAKEGTRDKDW